MQYVDPDVALDADAGASVEVGKLKFARKDITTLSAGNFLLECFLLMFSSSGLPWPCSSYDSVYSFINSSMPSLPCS